MLRLSVLLVGQRALAVQWRGRFVAGTGAHPARMAPDLAATLIAYYILPDDWVLDPSPASGTTSSKPSTPGATPSVSSTNPAPGRSQ